MLKKLLKALSLVNLERRLVVDRVIAINIRRRGVHFWCHVRWPLLTKQRRLQNFSWPLSLIWPWCTVAPWIVEVAALWYNNSLRILEAISALWPPLRDIFNCFCPSIASTNLESLVKGAVCMVGDFHLVAATLLVVFFDFVEVKGLHLLLGWLRRSLLFSRWFHLRN